MIHFSHNFSLCSIDCFSELCTRTFSLCPTCFPLNFYLNACVLSLLNVPPSMVSHCIALHRRNSTTACQTQINAILINHKIKIRTVFILFEALNDLHQVRQLYAKPDSCHLNRVCSSIVPLRSIDQKQCVSFWF